MRQIITGEDIEQAFRSGETELIIDAKDVITSVAREAAEKYGIRIKIAPDPAASNIHSSPSVSGHLSATSRNDGKFMPEFLEGERSSTQSDIKHIEGNPEPPFDIAYWRKQFPLLNTHIHVANCSQAPQSTFTRDAAMDYLDNWNEMGMDWDKWMEEIHYSKEEFAKIINVDVNEIAVGTSVSELTSVVASALPLNVNRKKIVITEAEFPTVGHVWQANQKYGYEIDFIPVKNDMIDINDYDRVVDENTLITSLCDVYYYNGFKQDLKRIIPKIHEKGSLAYVDAYQGLGTHPIDAKALDIDFLASGNLKYLLGVPGIAFLYVKKEIIEYLHPAFTGWFGRTEPFAFDIHNVDYAPDARRFDNGTPPVPTAYIARGGMKMINTVGVEKIYQWTNALSAHCINGAIERGLDIASPTELSIKAPNTAIRVPGDSHDFELALRKKGIIASARADVVRIAPHFFTRLEDLDYVLDCYVQLLHK